MAAAYSYGADQIQPLDLPWKSAVGEMLVPGHEVKNGGREGRGDWSLHVTVSFEAIAHQTNGTIRFRVAAKDS